MVRDEHGEEMHKSKGNAIWFEDAADNMGVDVMRWLFLRQNPANNVNFGYGAGGRSAPRRMFLTLWNTYAFFVTYANARRLDAGERGRRQHARTPSSTAGCSRSCTSSSQT